MLRDGHHTAVHTTYKNAKKAEPHETTQDFTTLLHLFAAPGPAAAG